MKLQWAGEHIKEYQDAAALAVCNKAWQNDTMDTAKQIVWQTIQTHSIFGG